MAHESERAGAFVAQDAGRNMDCLEGIEMMVVVLDHKDGVSIEAERIQRSSHREEEDKANDVGVLHRVSHHDLS
jgi:hypothetical protein